MAGDARRIAPDGQRVAGVEVHDAVPQRLPAGGVDEEGVVPGAANQEVGAGGGVDHVVAAGDLHCVVAGAGADEDAGGGGRDIHVVGRDVDELAGKAGGWAGIGFAVAGRGDLAGVVGVAEGLGRGGGEADRGGEAAGVEAEIGQIVAAVQREAGGQDAVLQHLQGGAGVAEGIAGAGRQGDGVAGLHVGERGVEAGGVVEDEAAMSAVEGDGAGLGDRALELDGADIGDVQGAGVGDIAGADDEALGGLQGGQGGGVERPGSGNGEGAAGDSRDDQQRVGGQVAAGGDVAGLLAVAVEIEMAGGVAGRGERGGVVQHQHVARGQAVEREAGGGRGERDHVAAAGKRDGAAADGNHVQRRIAGHGDGAGAAVIAREIHGIAHADREQPVVH